ncbi:hypothetical protein DVA80_21010 [Acinetobacter baumannii]|nr:hypothetical protein DVA80_21010 [Acinetobacter baumannii]
MGVGWLVGGGLCFGGVGGWVCWVVCGWWWGLWGVCLLVLFWWVVFVGGVVWFLCFCFFAWLVFFSS